jgi:solute carrier family 35 protein F5
VNASLDYTSVASATIMSSVSGKELVASDAFAFLISVSGFFTLGIGRIFKVETFSVTKIVAVAIR